jgi:hypothetical protein
MLFVIRLCATLSFNWMHFHCKPWKRSKVKRHFLIQIIFWKFQVSTGKMFDLLENYGIIIMKATGKPPQFAHGGSVVCCRKKMGGE